MFTCCGLFTWFCDTWQFGCSTRSEKTIVNPAKSVLAGFHVPVGKIMKNSIFVRLSIPAKHGKNQCLKHAETSRQIRNSWNHQLQTIVLLLHPPSIVGQKHENRWLYRAAHGTDPIPPCPHAQITSIISPGCPIRCTLRSTQPYLLTGAWKTQGMDGLLGVAGLPIHNYEMDHSW